MGLAPLLLVTALPSTAQLGAVQGKPPAPPTTGNLPAGASGAQKPLTLVRPLPAPPPVRVVINQYGNTDFIRPFPASEYRGAYEFSENDQFHYAIPYAAAAVRYAAYATYQQYGKALQPITICDCSTRDGETPAGRHPGSAHDGGVNFDITYFMNRPGDEVNFVVCPLNQGGHCVGPATDLDAQRQAYFFACLGKLDLELHYRLLQKMAVDAWVDKAVQPELDRLETSGAFGHNEIANAKRLIYSEAVDLGTGWFLYHHNHTHLRFQWHAGESNQLLARIENRLRGVVALKQTTAGKRTTEKVLGSRQELTTPAPPAQVRPGPVAPAAKPAPLAESFMLRIPHSRTPARR